MLWLVRPYVTVRPSSRVNIGARPDNVFLIKASYWLGR